MQAWNLRPGHGELNHAAVIIYTRGASANGNTCQDGEILSWRPRAGSGLSRRRPRGIRAHAVIMTVDQARMGSDTISESARRSASGKQGWPMSTITKAA